MYNLEYGISKGTVGEDNVESTVVKFGDGLTRISTCFWSDGISGIQLCRSDQLKTEAFKEYKEGDGVSPNDIHDDEKVYIVFDSERSIDIMITRLTEARDEMRGIKGATS